MKTHPVARPPRPGAPALRLGAALAVLGALVAGAAAVVRLPAASPWAGGHRSFGLFATLFVLYGVGAWLVSTLSQRRAAVLTLLGAVATQAATLTARPRYSTDLYRYVWDGIVQSHGIDPYRYVPMASRLAALRTPELFPATVAEPGHCVASGPGVTGGCTLLNRPLVHTIYPPVAQAYFWLTHWAGPQGVQVLAALFAVLVTVLLIRGLPRLGGDPRQAVLWAWCPTVAIEAGNGGHVDVLAVFLTCCALLILGSRRALSTARVTGGGLVLGLAVATKVTPVLAVPGLARRRPLPLLASVAGVVAAVYVPHVVAVGSGATGFLGGYLSAEGYESGGRFAVLNLLMPDSLAPVAAVVALAVVAAWVWWRADPDQPWRGALVMTGAALVIAAPSYPWYAELLVLLVAFTGWRAAPWLGLALAGYAAQGDEGARWGYGAAAVAVAVVALVRRRSVARSERAAVGRDPSGLFGLPGPADLTDLAAGHDLTGLPGLTAGNGPADPTAPAWPPAPVDVILPCLDEAEALPFVLGRMPVGYRPIVVDNGSTDGSPEIAAGLGALVVREPRRGFGAACHAGLEAATADVVCFMDCDASFDPADLPGVAEPVLAGTSDLFLGQRRPTTRGAWPPHARLANRLLALRIRHATGVRLDDLGPMRAARRESLLGLGITDRRFGYPLEMVLKAADAGWRIGQTDVPYAPRTGKSKVTGTVGGTLKAVGDMRRVWKAATG